jgi:hypothetical protein
LGPDKGFGAGIVLGEISVDGGLQIGDQWLTKSIYAIDKYE